MALDPWNSSRLEQLALKGLIIISRQNVDKHEFTMLSSDTGQELTCSCFGSLFLWVCNPSNIQSNVVGRQTHDGR